MTNCLQLKSHFVCPNIFQQLKVFETVCLNTKYFKHGEDFEKGTWDTTKKMADGTPIIKSARTFTDYCTILRLREKMQNKLERLKGQDTAKFDETVAENFIKDIALGK